MKIHRSAFRDSFLTRLGPAFLSRYYECVLNYEGGILWVSEGPNGVEGFVAGFVHPEAFYKYMKRSAWTFAVPVLSAVIRDPSLVKRVLYNFRRIGRGGTPEKVPACELSSIAVHPEVSGKHIGRSLVQAFLEEAWIKKADCVSLTTDADANELVNRFYTRLGFDLRRSFEQYRGRMMNQYVFCRPQAQT